MGTKKKEETEAEDMVYHRHPDGHLEEMTRSEAEALEPSSAKATEGKQKEIKTR